MTKSNLLTFAKKLIRIKSTFDNPKGLEDVLNLVISNLKNYTVEKFERNGVPSILVYKNKKRPKRFKIILNGHLDVIPGKENKYKPFVKKGRLYGVGSIDMKASVACLVAVFKDLADKLPYVLGLQLVTDEEIGGFNGTKFQIEKGVRSEFVIAAEPTNFDIVYKAKGILQVKIIASGKTAHSAYPWKGNNAILRMNKFIKLLAEKYPVSKKEEWVTTLNIARIETANRSLNKIPSDCSVWLDIRYVANDAPDILKDIKKLLPRDFMLEIIANESPMETDKYDKFIKLLQRAINKLSVKTSCLRGANGSSDARHFVKVGCPGIEFGPIGFGMGSDTEWTDIESLNKYCLILKNFLESVPN